jgi:phosphoglycerate kinase
MALPTLENFSWADETVLLRVDFNVPLDESGEVADDTRIRAALPTIKHLLDQNSRVIICSHLGRPKGRSNDSMSLLPAAKHLQGLLDREVLFSEQGASALAAKEKLGPGGILVLENLRFHPGEKKDDMSFAKSIAKLGSAYVNDAFGVLHRRHASVSALPSCIEKKAIGRLVQHEHDALAKLLGEESKPFVAVLGGAKVSDKIILMDNLTLHCEDILVGGAMAYTFLKAQGIEVGSSRVEEDKLSLARTLLNRCKERGVRLHLPTDHVVAEQFEAEAEASVSTEIPEGSMGLDIGPETQARYAEVISGARSVFWNGPMGVFEWESFSSGTRAVAQALVDSQAYSVVGGGDSAAALNRFELGQGVSHISTGGGASLAFLEGDPLPGLSVFEGAN